MLKKLGFMITYEMVNSELRKRFIESIDYLRKMDFFKDYSNLSSEEIFERILSGEINYGTQWFVEEWPEEKRKREEKRGRKYLWATRCMLTP